MGLDMYAMTTAEPIESEIDFVVEDAEEIHYWRKHPNLHGWMQQLYYDKGGKEDFNCVPVVLTLEDLERLEVTVKAGDLPATEGFFFGKSDGTEIEGDLDFVTKAREAITAGFIVFYDSWW